MQKDDAAQQDNTKQKKEKSETIFTIKLQNTIPINIVEDVYSPLQFIANALPQTFHLDLIKPPIQA